MTTPGSPPQIFSRSRRLAARARMAARRARSGAVETVAREIARDVLDRLGFLQHEAKNALAIGDVTGQLSRHLHASGIQVNRADPCPPLAPLTIDEEQPLPGGAYDLIISLGLLDSLNDLPGALLLMRRALAPGGLMIASFTGAGSLPRLRAAMLAADGEMAAPRIHPQIDVWAAGQLMNRCGFVSPVVDAWGFDVAFSSLEQLVSDLRDQALGNLLNDFGPPLSRTAVARARNAFTSETLEEMVTERFEIITLSGWAPVAKR